MSGTPTTPFGKQFREKYFAFDPTYTPLNHGSFGATPKPVLAAQEAERATFVANPDKYLLHDLSDKIDSARKIVAGLVNAPSVDNLVFVTNATIGVNTVLRSWRFRPGDVVISASTTYGACYKTLDFLVQQQGIVHERVPLHYPLRDEDEVVELYKATLDAAREKHGHDSVKFLFFDGVSSMPGCRLPWEKLIELARAEGVLSFVDAAHSIGLLEGIDLTAHEPDFYVSNLHKWYFTPTPAAFLYIKNGLHDQIQSFPVSHSFISFDTDGGHGNKLLKEKFSFIGTADYSNPIVVDAARKFRNEVCGGEHAIKDYCYNIAVKGAELFARTVPGVSVFETYTSPAPGSHSTNTSMINLLLTHPKLDYTIAASPERTAELTTIALAISKRLLHDHNVVFPFFAYDGKLMFRLSGQVYLDEADFEKGAEALKSVLEAYFA
ncbi:hypothetical protein D0Z00_002613 [Geotrichum galactomycetum]|uniref:Uncharacterized protein n=1 Tax=Geotrichum galactomycetum TaxID=27317 RepID=A0ACB6V3L3_9ASCO|nr:hypothetical protein D0Z00_002613 [Geotrichum candidum]